MADIFDNIELSSTFNQEQLINELFKENLRLQAKQAVQQEIFEDLLMNKNGFDRKKASSILNKLYEDKINDIFVNSRFLSEAWKNDLRRQLGDLPGINFDAPE